MRLGVVGYVNTLPLAEGLEAWLPGASCRRGTPAEIAAALEAGDLDVGLVPVAVWARHPEWSRVPGLGIASHGPVRSVLLVSKDHPQTVSVLVEDPASRTSNLLARLWLRHRMGREVTVRPGPPKAERRWEAGDATVVIGDDALAWNEARGVHTDLGAAWTEWTGNPFVFAVWAGPRAQDPRLQEALHACARANASRIPELSRGVQGADAQEIETYLTRNIHYRLGPQYERGLAEFLELARDAGWLPRPQEEPSHVSRG